MTMEDQIQSYQRPPHCFPFKIGLLLCRQRDLDNIFSDEWRPFFPKQNWSELFLFLRQFSSPFSCAKYLLHQLGMIFRSKIAYAFN